MKRFADKYFLRANEILKAEEINPWVNMQVFCRKGPGIIAGIDESVEVILNNSNIIEAGGRIYGKKDGNEFDGSETVMNIIAPIKEIMELETVYLGIPSRATTLANGGNEIEIPEFEEDVREVVQLVGERPVLYFGARHWDYRYDEQLSAAAFRGGVKGCSTDAGAESKVLKGSGTIPHALENIYAWIYGKENAVVEATKAFDRVISKDVPRIALVDYNNKEIDDSLATAEALEGNLNAVRVDTCGENVAQGGKKDEKRYWEGRGVTIEGIYALRKRLDDNVGIVLSSGFSNPAKVKAFLEAEKQYGVKLFDAIGAGFLDGVRTFTADIVAVGNYAGEVDFYKGEVNERNVVHKRGRYPRPNFGLEQLV